MDNVIERVCRRCGVRHVSKFKACDACRLAEKRKRIAYEMRKSDKGLCCSKGCWNAKSDHAERCQACLDKLKARYAKQHDKGLCGYCNEPHVKDRKFCATHLAKLSKAYKAHVRRKKALGFCARCPKRAPDGKNYCSDCIYYGVVRHRRKSN